MRSSQGDIEGVCNNSLSESIKRRGHSPGNKFEVFNVNQPVRVLPCFFFLAFFFRVLVVVVGLGLWHSSVSGIVFGYIFQLNRGWQSPMRYVMSPPFVGMKHFKLVWDIFL